MNLYRVTAEDIITCAAEIIDKHGWARSAWPKHGPAPRCIRAALEDAWKHLHDNDPRADSKSLTEAIRRVSEAIYGPGCIGGIVEWEYKKRTDRAQVLQMLAGAADLAKAAV